MERRNGSNTAITSQALDGSPGSYALRELIRDIPLSTDENGVQAHITCVEAWNGNIYIGTSSGEVLHYVVLPSDPSADDDDQPSCIFATNIEPPYTHQQEGVDVGVKQILLLPSVDKACILCNGTLTFYSLPELSPAYGGRIKQGSCLWVGGLDRNTLGPEFKNKEGEVVVICLRPRLRLINIGRGTAQKVRDIELGGVTAVERRGDLACVANGEKYSLLDVVNQRQNVLFPISSLDDFKPLPDLPQEALTPSHSRQTSKSFSSTSPVRQPRSHERNISVGGTPKNSLEPRAESGSPWPTRRSSREVPSPAQPSSRTSSPTKDTGGVTNPATPEEQPSPDPVKAVKPLLPNLVSPTADEFFLTTGTTMDDPGIGMFVNLDGDVVRGTVEFSSYPESLVLDSHFKTSLTNGLPGVGPQEGYTLALVRKKVDNVMSKGIEIQRWDVDPGESHRTKEWLALNVSEATLADTSDHRRIGLRNATSTVEVTINEISASLRSRRIRVGEIPKELDAAELARNKEEDKYSSRFSQVQANVLLFEEGRISWVLRNPLIVQLDQQLNSALQKGKNGQLSINAALVQRVINSIRGQEAHDELEFLTLTYIRQKASLLLFGSLILQTVNDVISKEIDKGRAEEILVDGELDPRPILILVPPLQEEIVEGPEGIWLAQGLRDVINTLKEGLNPEQLAQSMRSTYKVNVLHVIKKYLLTWRKKKGFGSVADEANVFKTVDAALLRVLLILDQYSPVGPVSKVPNPVRSELNNVVDGGVECFDRAVKLLEQFNRIYVLSRLYQSRKMVSQVLSSWKRILEGEHDAGGELINGEQDLRSYLTKISNSSLVQEYGSWLANRNPKLGVQVFADDSSRVKFQPTEAVAILKEKAPNAVKDYLEHLVFGKNHVQYVNDLIAFYLDTVLTELTDSPSSREALLQSYTTYRALRPPKPTYRQFITDNSPSRSSAEWWHNRLRLLQLIGGSHGAASKYDVRSLGARLAPFTSELVPEMIILHSREGRHAEALRLLVRELGDHDTAVRYCLLGGENIFHLRSVAAAASSSSSSSSSSTSASAGGEEGGEAGPSFERQAALFKVLLEAFFALEDGEERGRRAAELLERFGAWFEVDEVLAAIPIDWPVRLVGGFLVRALRRLVAERRETGVVRALHEARNLRICGEFVEVCEKGEAVVVKAEEVGGVEVG